MPSFRPLPSALRGVARNRPADSSAPAAAPAPIEGALVDCGVYIDGQRQLGAYSPAAALSRVGELEHTGRPAFVWIGLHQPDEHQMQGVADEFGLHPLAVEDAVHAHQRPKLDRYDETLFLVLKTINYVPATSAVLTREIVETGEIMIFVGRNFVVTVRHGEHVGLSEVRKRMDAEPSQVRLGPYAVMHAIADHVVDHYRAITDMMEDDIDNVEEAAFTPDRRTDVEPIYQIKREVVELRRSVAPLWHAFQRLQNNNKDLISTEVRRYLVDVADHQAQAADRIASYDELLNSLVQAALARVGMQQNADMRKISAWAAMLAVPTLIAGIYGMNFADMPALGWEWGYPMTLLVMASICLALYRTFRRNDWL